MVELRVFALPDGAGFLVCPRTLVKTEVLSRVVVQIEDERGAIAMPSSANVQVAKSAPKSITAEQFYEEIAKLDPALPGKLHGFVARVARLDVVPEFRRSLNLKWNLPSGEGL